MAKAKSKGRKRNSFTIPLGIIAGLGPTAAFAYQGFKIPGDQGGIVEAAHRVTMRLTGYEWKGNVWNMNDLLAGWGPLLLGAIAHKAANRFGINRMIAAAGIPVLRV